MTFFFFFYLLCFRMTVSLNPVAKLTESWISGRFTPTHGKGHGAAGSLGLA